MVVIFGFLVGSQFFRPANLELIARQTAIFREVAYPRSLRNRRLIFGNIFAKHKEDTREGSTLPADNYFDVDHPDPIKYGGGRNQTGRIKCVGCNRSNGAELSKPGSDYATKHPELDLQEPKPVKPPEPPPDGGS